MSQHEYVKQFNSNILDGAFRLCSLLATESRTIYIIIVHTVLSVCVINKDCVNVCVCVCVCR